MDEREADERYTRLVANVAAVRDLLRRAGEEHWDAWMSYVHAELIAHDAHGLTRLLGAYGGMGSFTDLVIREVDGQHAIEPATRSLAALRTSMYTDAKALLQDFEQAP